MRRHRWTWMSVGSQRGSSISRAENVHIRNANGINRTGTVHRNTRIIIGLLQYDVNVPLLLVFAKLTFILLDPPQINCHPKNTPRRILAPSQRESPQRSLCRSARRCRRTRFTADQRKRNRQDRRNRYSVHDVVMVEEKGDCVRRESTDVI